MQPAGMDSVSSQRLPRHIVVSNFCQLYSLLAELYACIGGRRYIQTLETSTMNKFFVKIFDGDFMFSPFSQKTRCSLWLNDIIGQPLRAPTRSFTDFGAEGAEEEAMNSS